MSDWAVGLNSPVVATILAVLTASLVGCTPASGLAQSAIIETAGFVEGPRIASDARGNAWLLWLTRLTGGREQIYLSTYRGQWSSGSPLAGAAGRLESPVIACAPGGTPMAVWVKLEENRWKLVSSAYSAGRFGAPVRVPSGRGKAANPDLAAGAEGDYWLTWESYYQGRFKVLLVHYANGKWGRPLEVTDGISNAYSPALAVDASGAKVWVAYTAVEGNKQYSIYLKSLDIGSRSLSSPIAIAIGGRLTHRPNLNKYPSVACDSQGRVWVAYERDSLRGRRGATDDRPNVTGGPHMGARDCSVVCYQSGQLHQVAAVPPNPNGRDVLAGANDHYPTLLQDPGGRMWVFSRDSVSKPQPPWNLRASCLNGRSGWTAPSSLLDSFPLGRLSRPAVAFTTADTMWVAWQSDNLFLGVMANEQTNIRVARIEVPAADPQAGAPLLEPTTADAGDRTGTELGVRPWIERRQTTEGNTRYTLLYGNLHEHTLLSRCWMDGSDGISDDDYRYGRDVEGYDFVGLTDHGFDLGEYEWRKTIRAAEFYNDPPYYIGVCGYEWTKSGLTVPGPTIPLSSGHRNIFFASAKDAGKFVSSVGQVYECNLPESDTMAKVWQILRAKKITDAITIPHHPADRQHTMDWNVHDPHYQSVVEIFQCRQSAEYAGCPRDTAGVQGCYVQDALARGYKMGFIASGDHNSMGVGLAAIWVKEVSPRGIIEALLARRCYATTGDKIFLDFRVDGHLMGEEYRSPGPPHLTARIECVSPIKEIVVFKNNRVLVNISGALLGSRTSYDLEYVDKDFGASSYYYLRVIQDDGEIGWASPVWVVNPG
jgi:hypothetical protein